MIAATMRQTEDLQPLPSDRRAVFVDKDGTLLHNVPYSVDAAKIRFHEGAVDALARLSLGGYAVVLVTNQSGVAHGHFTESQLARYLAELEERLAIEGVPVLKTYYCPHHPEGSIPRYRRFCACRKPNPGMLARAASELRLDLGRSWMLGDLLDDVEAGARAGCFTALVNHDGNEAVPEVGVRCPRLIAPSLAAAAERILAWQEAVA